MNRTKIPRAKRGTTTPAVTLIALAAAFGFAGTPAAAQCPSDWLSGNAQIGVNGQVAATSVWDPDGSGPRPELLVAGGGFTIAGEVPAANIAAFDGARWHALGAGAGEGDPSTASVFALAVYNGDLIAGGSFMTAGGVAASRIARWDGVRWHPLGAGIGGEHACVSAMTVLGDDLIVGGSFTMAGGVNASNMARWDGANWHGMSGGTNGWVQALTIHDGHLLAGGVFHVAGTTPVNNLARWDGAQWHPIGPQAPLEWVAVDSFARYAGELLIAGVVYGPPHPPGDDGDYWTSPGIVLRWDGASWTDMSAGILTGEGGSYYGAVHQLTVHSGDLFALTAGVVFRWNGAAWESLPYVTGGTDSLCIFNGVLTAAGYGAGFARWEGAAWRLLGSGFGSEYHDTVRAVAEYNGELIAGGQFTAFTDGQRIDNLARWDGAAWRPLGSGVNGRVFALAVYDGQLIAGGEFTLAGGAPANCIARWDGSTWSPLGVGMGGNPYPWVLALAVRPNGRLVAGGMFSEAGGMSASRVAQWDGGAWSGLGSGMGGADPTVHALAVMPNGDLVAGGNFSTAGTSSANRIARWDGRGWSALGAGMTNAFPYASSVHELAVLPSGDLVAGGAFTLAGSAPANRIARWNGSAWSALGAGVEGGPNASVGALAVLPGGDLAAGGAFSSAGGSPANNIARWDGSAWSALDDGITGREPYVASLAVLPNGDLVAGGRFLRAGPQPAVLLARWGPDCPRGDANCDGSVDFFDIDPFLLALLDEVGYAAQYPGCDRRLSDLDDDGQVSFFDIEAFVACLFNGECH